MAANTVSKINIKLGAQTGDLQRGFARAEQHTRQFSTRVGGLGGQLASVGGAFAKAAAAAGAFLGVGSVVAGFRFGVQLAAQAETARVGFEVLLGSAEKAQSLFGDLQQFAESTPLEFPEIQKAAKSLLAFGTSVEEIVPTLQALGDVAAGVDMPLSELAEIYGKARVQGRLFMEDINQLTGRGIPIIQELAEQFGVTEGEVRKLVESGAVGFENLRTAFANMTEDGGQFGGMMEKQSQTLSGRWSTLVDNVRKVGIAFGEALMPAAKAALEALFPLTGDLTTAIKTWSPAITEFAMSFAERFTEIINTIRAGIQSFTELGHWITKTFGPEAIANIGRGIGDLITNAHRLMTLPGEIFRELFGGGVGDAIEQMGNDASDQQKKLSDFVEQTTDNFAAMEEQTKAAAKRMEELAKSGEQLTSSLRTPFEVIADDLARAQELMQAGVISWQTYMRAIASAETALGELNKTKEEMGDTNVGFVDRNTQEGYAAMFGKSSQNAIVDELKANNVANQQQIALLQQVITAAKEGGVTVVKRTLD